ncbi:MAG: hypothetical protein LJF06_11450 [Gemmatimonadetes bacterium]|nr:hypothetical protein [Gemmatimonadota bacterium]
MRSTGATPWRFVALLALSAAVGLPASLAGQFTPRAPAQRQRPDFMFGRPHVSLTILGGYAIPSATPNGVINTQLPTDQALTFYRKNFNSAAVTGELAVRATDRLDIIMDLGYSGGKVRSEYTNWVDNNNLPIQQTTRLTRTPLTFGVKAYLWSPGRSIGQLAWIPAHWVPFVGAGAGWVWYRFEQSGDWVNFQNNNVYSDTYRASGRGATANVFGGADWSVSPHLVLTAEGRYSWAHAPMGGDFQNFRDINLSGFRASAGISLRF